MKEILEKFKKEILNHEEAKNYTSLIFASKSSLFCNTFGFVHFLTI